MKNIIFIVSGLLISNLIMAVLAFAQSGPADFQSGPADFQGKKEGRVADISQKMPQVEFISPKQNTKVKETFKIQALIKEALGVEFYLRRPESLTQIYLGKGIFSGNEFDNNLWEILWDTTLYPNGAYILSAKVINQYGEYFSNEVFIEIKNEIKRDEEKEKKLKTRIVNIEDDIKKNEEEINRKKEEVKQEIQENLNNPVQEINKGIEILTENIKEKENEKEKKEKNQKAINEYIEDIEDIQKELKKLSSEKNEISQKEKNAILDDYQKQKENFEKEIIASNQKLEDLNKKKEQIKQEIIQKAIETIKPVEKISGIKKDVLKEKKEIEKKINNSLEKLETTVSEKEKIRIKKISPFFEDTDKDGLSDKEEIRLGADPFNPDSDKDGFLDGAEINNGFDPLNPSPAAKIIYQDPRNIKPKNSEFYKIEMVEIVNLPTKEVGLKFSGKALPNSFITLYIFSSPLVLVVKTNKDGNWSYTLSKPLSDGSHEVYAAASDNRGQITARSEAFVFTLAENKVVALLPSTEEKVLSPAKALQRSYLILTIGVIIFTIGIAFFIIGLSQKEKKDSLSK